MKTRGALFLLVIAATFSFFFTPTIAEAQYYSSNQIVDFIWVKTFGFKSQWLNQPRDIILQVILPSLAVYAIFLGLIRTLQIFRGMGSMEHLIAVVVTLSSLFMGWIGWVSAWMALLGVWSIVIFIFMILVGGGLYSYGFIRSSKQRYVNEILSDYQKATNRVYRDIDNYNRHISRIDNEILNLTIKGIDPNSKRMRKLKDSRAELMALIKEAQKELANIDQEFNSMPPPPDNQKKK
jgi:hypothetical protein